MISLSYCSISKYFPKATTQYFPFVNSRKRKHCPERHIFSNEKLSIFTFTRSDCFLYGAFCRKKKMGTKKIMFISACYQENEVLL